jgi:hypothetical protein
MIVLARDRGRDQPKTRPRQVDGRRRDARPDVDHDALVDHAVEHFEKAGTHH